MSFLRVAGKIFICESCNAAIQVKYEGGGRLTKIGARNVRRQIELSEKIGQPNDNPEEDGFYLYDFGICEKCYTKTMLLQDSYEKDIKRKILIGYRQIIEEKT